MQEGNATLLYCFPKDYLAVDVNRSKCLHVTSSNALSLVTWYITNFHTVTIDDWYFFQYGLYQFDTNIKPDEPVFDINCEPVPAPSTCTVLGYYYSSDSEIVWHWSFLFNVGYQRGPPPPFPGMEGAIYFQPSPRHQASLPSLVTKCLEFSWLVWENHIWPRSQKLFFQSPEFFIYSYCKFLFFFFLTKIWLKECQTYDQKFVFWVPKILFEKCSPCPVGNSAPEGDRTWTVWSVFEYLWPNRWYFNHVQHEKYSILFEDEDDMDFDKAFDKVYHSLLIIHKLHHCGISNQPSLHTCHISYNQPYLCIHAISLAHLETNSHKIFQVSHRIFRPSYSTFYEEINLNHTLLCWSQASYILIKAFDYFGGAPKWFL